METLPMGNRKFIEDLKDLVQLDYDAIQAYDQATSHINEDHIRHTLYVQLFVVLKTVCFTQYRDTWYIIIPNRI